jgi:hypothetical protein
MNDPTLGRQASRLTPPAGGSIAPNLLYRLDEAKARLGWRDAAYRAAVRAGLTVYRSGKRAFILGSDIIAYITRGGVSR